MEYIVIHNLNRARDCRVVGASDAYPAIYRRAFGPASKEACEKWAEEHCGPERH